MEFVRLLNAKTWPWLALLLSGGLLCGAWFFQYVLGYPPCQMCYWQRHVHKLVIGLSILALIMNQFGLGAPKYWVWLIGVALLGSFAVAFWHVGVEFKWWDGPKTCVSGSVGNTEFDPKDWDKIFEEPIKPPACSEALWHFLGLSMAGWNAVISFMGGVASFVSGGRKNDETS